MPNQWNDFIDGVLGGVKPVLDAWTAKMNANNLDDLYGTLTKNLKDAVKPMSEHVAGVPGQGGELASMYQEGANAKVDPQAGLNSLYDGIRQLIPYGKDAQPYSAMLQNLYQANIPTTETKDVGGHLLQITTQPTGQTSIKDLYGADKLTPYSQEKPRVMMNEDGSFSVQSFWNKNGKLESQMSPIDSKTGQELYIQQMASDATKDLSWQDKEDIKQQNKIDFHMSIGNGKNGKGRSPKYDPLLDTGDVQKDLKNFDLMNKSFDSNKNDIEWVTKRNKLQKDLMEKLHLNYDDLGKISSEIGMTGVTEGKKKIDAMLSDDNTDVNPMNQINEAKQKALDYANQIQTIGKQIQDKFQNLYGMLQSGQLDQTGFTQTIQNWWNDNGSKLPVEVRNEVVKQLKQNNIAIKF